MEKTIIFPIKFKRRITITCPSLLISKANLTLNGTLIRGSQRYLMSSIKKFPSTQMVLNPNFPEGSQSQSWPKNSRG